MSTLRILVFLDVSLAWGLKFSNLLTSVTTMLCKYQISRSLYVVFIPTNCAINNLLDQIIFIEPIAHNKV